MRPTLSASRLIVVVTLAVVMLVSESEGEGRVGTTCYQKYSKTSVNTQDAPPWAKNIISCSEQNHHGCKRGYVIKTSRKTFFLSPDTEWVTRKIKEGTLNCPLMISVVTQGQ